MAVKHKKKKKKTYRWTPGAKKHTDNRIIESDLLAKRWQTVSVYRKLTHRHKLIPLSSDQIAVLIVVCRGQSTLSKYWTTETTRLREIKIKSAGCEFELDFTKYRFRSGCLDFDKCVADNEQHKQFNRNCSLSVIDLDIDRCFIV